MSSLTAYRLTHMFSRYHSRLADKSAACSVACRHLDHCHAYCKWREGLATELARTFFEPILPSLNALHCICFANHCTLVTIDRWQHVQYSLSQHVASVAILGNYNWPKPFLHGFCFLILPIIAVRFNLDSIVIKCRAIYLWFLIA
jgi:hypothetical protein